MAPFFMTEKVTMAGIGYHEKEFEVVLAGNRVGEAYQGKFFLATKKTAFAKVKAWFKLTFIQ